MAVNGVLDELLDVLFIGQTYFDLTALLDGKPMPTGNHKDVFGDYELGFGGNALVAGLTLKKFGGRPHLLTTVADDRLGTMFSAECKEHHVPLYSRSVKKSALSVVMPEKGERAIARFRHDEPYENPVPPIDIRGMRMMHVDGHQHDAVMQYALQCRELGIPTSLDLGRLRGEDGKNTFEQLPLMDIIIAAEEIPEAMGLSVKDLFARWHSYGCQLAAITCGAAGVVWQETGGELLEMPAFPVPTEYVIDTAGAGDVFHGAFVYSKVRWWHRPWEMHLRFASAAASFAIQKLGTEAGIPELEHVERLVFPGPIAVGQN